jgi:DNA helicase IV
LGALDQPQVSKDWTSKLVTEVGQLLQLASMELETYKSKFERTHREKQRFFDQMQIVRMQMESMQASLMEQMEKMKFLEDESNKNHLPILNVVEGSCDPKVHNDYFESLSVIPLIKLLPKLVME